MTLVAFYLVLMFAIMNEEFVQHTFISVCHMDGVLEGIE